jgi:tetratricopeptide (TPR) repeat protein
LIGGMENTPAENVSALMYAAVSYNHQAPIKALEICKAYLRATGGIETITPYNAGALINIAGIYYRNDLIDTVSILCNRYIELMGGIDKITAGNSHFLILMARTHMSKDNMDGANEAYYHYGRLMGLEKTPSEYLPYIANYHYTTRNYPKALEICTQYLQKIGGIGAITPGSEGILINIISIYYRNERMDLALEACNRYFQLLGGMDKVPAENCHILTIMARACIRQNNIDGGSEACSHYNRLVGTAHPPINIVPYIGHYYYAAKDYKSALSIYNNYFKKIGGLDKAPAELAWIAREAIAARRHLDLDPGVKRRHKEDRPMSPLATSRALKLSECTRVERKEPLAPKPPLGSSAGQTS